MTVERRIGSRFGGHAVGLESQDRFATSMGDGLPFAKHIGQYGGIVQILPFLSSVAPNCGNSAAVEGHLSLRVAVFA